MLQERQITTRLHALCLGVGEEAARQILERDLQKRKICYRFVAHSVTVDGGEHRVECCSNLIDFADQDRDELQRIVSGCESWCFQFNPEKKRQLNEFSSAEEHQVANVACQENADFFLCYRNYPTQVCSWRHHSEQSVLFSVDRTFVLAHGPCQKREVRNSSWLLLHDKEDASCALNVKQFSCFQIHLYDPPSPYSPDLVPEDSFLFPKVKQVLKGESFNDISDIQCGVTEILQGVSLQDFQRALENMYKRCGIGE